jgi:hypothetical protein
MEFEAFSDPDISNSRLLQSDSIELPGKIKSLPNLYTVWRIWWPFFRIDEVWKWDVSMSKNGSRTAIESR